MTHRQARNRASVVGMWPSGRGKTRWVELCVCHEVHKCGMGTGYLAFHATHTLPTVMLLF